MDLCGGIDLSEIVRPIIAAGSTACALLLTIFLNRWDHRRVIASKDRELEAKDRQLKDKDDKNTALQERVILLAEKQAAGFEMVKDRLRRIDYALGLRKDLRETAATGYPALPPPSGETE